MKVPLRGFFKNIVLNSGTMIFYAASLQIFIYPLLSQLLDPEVFGQILTNMAVVNVGGIVIGSTISNLLMKEYSKYDDKAEFLGEFSRYNNCYIFVLAIIMPLIILVEYYFIVHSDILLTTLIVFILSLKLYLLSELRIKVDYLNIGISRIITVVGYLIGFSVYKNNFFSHPMCIILIGELVTVFYIGIGSKILRSNINFNYERELIRKFFGLFLSVLSNNSISYSDRFILSKIIGFNALPGFYAACVSGRLLQMFFNVISNVLFSYLVNMKNNSIGRYRLLIILFSILIGFFSWMGLGFITPYMIEFLYPKLFSSAMAIVVFTNISFSVKVSEILIRPVILRILNIRWIALVDSVFAVTYIVGGVLSTIDYGIQGFAICFSLLSIIKLVFLYLLLMLKGSVKSSIYEMKIQRVG